ncbi:MAG: hypothetical protein WC208_13520 [Gallionella sp.]|jgi:hypothetical protein
MAALTQLDISGTKQVLKFTWTLTTADHTGDAIPADYAEWADRTVYVVGGTWGAATLVWEGGSSASKLTLTDAQTVAISKTADFIETVVETPEYSRPRLSAVGAGATMTVTCIARKGAFKR